MNNKKTNRFMAVLLSLCMMLGMLTSFGITVAAADITVINTVEELKAFRDSVNSGDNYSGKTVTLNANLDLSGETNWTPIGTSSRPFKGIFDGGNHVIYNLTINTDNRYCGLFGYINGAILQNLGIEDAKITSTGDDVAILSGYAGRSNIQRCYVTGSVKGYAAVSGLLGSTYDGVTAVENCYARVDLTPTVERGDTAGISGWNSKSSIQIVNCYSACIGEQRPIAGWSDGAAVPNEKITNTYFDSILSPNFSSDAGRADLGRTSAQLKIQSTFEDWDFDTVWAIDQAVNGGYPYLRGFTPGLGGAPGSISVTVTDTSGNPVTDAAVSIKHTTSNQETSLSHQGNGVAQIRVQIETHTHCVCGGVVTTGSHVCSGDTKWTAWRTADAMPAESGSYYLTGDVNLNGSWVIPAGVTIALCLNGHTLKYAGNTIVKGVVHMQGGTLNICDCADDGIITGGNGNSFGAGGIFIEDGTVSLYSGSISGNKTTSFGGGVRIGGDSTAGTFFLYGGSVSGNEVTGGATGGGGGIYVFNGAFTMYDGSISNNTGGYGGGGVYVYKGNFVMNGGSITGNTAGVRGGGIMMSNDDNSVVLSGAPVITGNTVNSIENNLYLLSRKTITVDTLTQGGKIGVTTYTAPTEGSPVFVTGRNNADYSGYFTSDDVGYVIENSTTNTVQLAVPHIHSFAVQSTDEKYLKTPADCEHAAKYYTSCACGESSQGTNGETTFTSGAALGHDYGVWSSNGNGTHTRTCAHDPSHTETKDCSGGTATYFKKAVCQDCQAEYGALLTDTTAPTGEIVLGENRWNRFLNTITFGLFFKETQTVTITANDDSCNHDGYTDDKAVKVEYYLSEQALTETEAKAIEEWNAYTVPFNIDPNHKVIVYVKLTDHAGNETVISSDGIVIYSDANPAELSISFTKCSVQNVTAELELKDNTVNAVLFNGQPLTAEHYTVSEQGMVFKASWLDTLAAGIYTLTVTYNPLGVDYKEAYGNEAPDTTTITLTVSKNAGSVTELSDLSKTYDGAPVEDVSYSRLSTGAVTVEYKAKGADDAAYTTVKPSAVGEYTVRVTVAADENYEKASATRDFKIRYLEAPASPYILLGDRGANGWFIGDVTVVPAEGYVIASALGGNYSDQLTVASGKSDLTVYLKNAQGQMTDDIAVESIKIDKVVPTVTAAGDTQTFKQSDTAAVTTSAGESGIAKVEVSKDGVYADITASYQNGYTVTANGVYTFRVTNGAGVTAENSITYTNIDTVKPVVAIDSGGYIGGNWTREYVTLMPSNTAANLGITTFEYKVGDGQWQTYTAPIIVSADTTGTVYIFRAISASGVVSDEASITVKKDAVAPGGDIRIKGNPAKQLLNSITFGLFFKENVDVEISGTDENSGIASVEFFRSENVLTEEQVKALDGWTAYTDKISETVEDAKKFVYYVKITDNAGNVTYFGSNGVTFDTTVSAISGVTDGETYYTTQMAEIQDVNLESVSLNSSTVTGPITLDGNKEATYTITAADKAGNTITVTVTMKPIASLSQPTDDIVPDHVKSSDNAAIEAVKAAAEAVDQTNATDAEKAVLQEILNKCDELLERLADITAESKAVTDGVGGYNAETVKSSDQTVIEALIERTDVLLGGDNLTQAEIAALNTVKETAEALLEKISDITAEAKRITDTAEAYSLDTVKSSDKADIEQLAANIETLLATQNLTETEKAMLKEIKAALEALEENIADTVAEITDITDKANGYNLGTVTSDDRADLVNLIDRIDVLLNGDALTEKEKSDLTGTKEAAECLLDKMDEVAKAIDTEKVKDITAENVIPEDKDDLEKAKEDLEKALEDYTNNLTEDEKKAIQDDIDRIYEALKVIEKVKAVEDQINALPDTVTKDNAEAIKAAESVYNALTDYEKSLVNTDCKTKLDKAVANLAELNKPADTTSPITGDNSRLWLWFALMFISGSAITTFAVYSSKKRAAQK